MVRLDDIYKTEVKGNGVVLDVCAFLFCTKSKLLTELQRTYFEWDSVSKRFLSHFYYSIILGIRESSKFASQNCRLHEVSLEVAYLKKWYNQIGMSKAYSTSIIKCWVGKQENGPFNKPRKFKIFKQLLVLKLSQTIKNRIKAEKVKMEIITPVVNEDIVAHLLQNVNEDGKFFKIYKFIVGEANLIAAWLEIKSKVGMLRNSGIGTNNAFSIIENLPLKWFKETSKMLMEERYNYKLVRTMKISKKRKDKYRKFTIAYLYDKIIQKAFHRVLNVMFEGYSEWEKISEKIFKAYHSEVTDYIQIFKKRKNNEYWLKKYKITIDFFV